MAVLMVPAITVMRAVVVILVVTMTMDVVAVISVGDCSTSKFIILARWYNHTFRKTGIL
jgi:hypothetical protein